jgi:hypothetical protein
MLKLIVLIFALMFSSCARESIKCFSTKELYENEFGNDDDNIISYQIDLNTDDKEEIVIRRPDSCGIRVCESVIAQEVKKGCFRKVLATGLPFKVLKSQSKSGWNDIESFYRGDALSPSKKFKYTYDKERKVYVKLP